MGREPEKVTGLLADSPCELFKVTILELLWLLVISKKLFHEEIVPVFVKVPILP